MPRKRPRPVTTPAQALEAAMATLARQLEAAPPDKCGALVKQLAALAKDLAQERNEEAARSSALAKPDPEALAREQREFDAEMERLIQARVDERVDWELRGKAEHEAWVAGMRKDRGRE